MIYPFGFDLKYSTDIERYLFWLIRVVILLIFRLGLTSLQKWKQVSTRVKLSLLAQVVVVVFKRMLVVEVAILTQIATERCQKIWVEPWKHNGKTWTPPWAVRALANEKSPNVPPRDEKGNWKTEAWTVQVINPKDTGYPFSTLDESEVIQLKDCRCSGVRGSIGLAKDHWCPNGSTSLP